jgi:hypothetical protein
MAGIFDGEGCIALHKKKTKKGTEFYRPKITVTNTDPRLIKICLDTFGGRYSTHRPKNKKVEYIWTPGGIVPQINFLSIVGDYLYVKKEQSDILLEFLKTKDNLPKEIHKKVSEQLSECKHREPVTTNTPNTWIKDSIFHSYLAGLTDAEGCISGYLVANEGDKAQRLLNVANNVKSIIDFIHSRYEGYVQTTEPKKKEHRISYKAWISVKSSQFDFLNHVLPYIKLKKDQAELMLIWIGIEGRNKAARQELCGKIQSLNHLKIESELCGDVQSGSGVIRKVERQGP